MLSDNPQPSKTPEQQLEELRLLLIHPDEIVDRVSPQKRKELQEQLVTTDVVVDKIGPHLIEIIEERVEHAPDPFARSLAPIMGEAIRRQVYLSRDDIVDALYPAIGQMINRAVNEAMRDLARSIDERLKKAQPRNPFVSARSQISEGEYQLRAAIPFHIGEIFLIHRTTGILIAHSAGDAHINDRDLISGMLTAIRSFARDAFGQGNEELESIEYESEQIVFAVGSAAYLAAVIQGVPPTDFRQNLEKLVIQMHAANYDEIRFFDGSDTHLVKTLQSSLQGFMADITTKGTSASSSARLSGSQKVILTLLILVLLSPVCACGFWLWSVEARLRALDAQPALVLATAILPSPTLQPSPTGAPTALPSVTPTALPSVTPTVLPTTAPSPQAFAMEATLTGNVYPLNLPSLEGIKRETFLIQNSQVLILERTGEWYHVRAKTPDAKGVFLEGWVLKQWIEPVNTDIEIPTAGVAQP